MARPLLGAVIVHFAWDCFARTARKDRDGNVFASRVGRFAFRIGLLRKNGSQGQAAECPCEQSEAIPLLRRQERAVLASKAIILAQGHRANCLGERREAITLAQRNRTDCLCEQSEAIPLLHGQAAECPRERSEATSAAHGTAAYCLCERSEAISPAQGQAVDCLCEQSEAISSR